MSSVLSRGGEFLLTVEKPVSGGRMLARYEGQVVLVAGAIPGERVRVRIGHMKKHVAFADTVDVLEPSPDRRTAGAHWACGGSLYAHIAYARQLSLKSEIVADALARIAKINVTESVPIMASIEDGYRMRARLHVRDGRIGFVREGSHELCDAGPTRQLLPQTIEVLERIEAALPTSSGQTPLSCEVSENISAEQRAIALEFGEGRFTLAPGCDSPYVTDRIDIAGHSLSLTRHVKSFFQGNRWLLLSLVARVHGQVEDERVIDLYAGVGLFAVALAAGGGRTVTAVEGDAFGARDLQKNALPFADSLIVHNTSVERYLRRQKKEDTETVVLDPPRAGVSREAMAGLLALQASRVVYVSCDVATLARDVKHLVDGGYRLDHLEAFDMFPNTGHVETLVILNLR